MKNWLAIALCFATQLAHSISATSPEAVRIFGLYQRGLHGDRAAVDACIAELENVLKRDPGNQLARVYLGSAYTLRSRDLGFGLMKLKTLREGVELMDQAVAAAPDDPKVRLARALTAQALPFFAVSRDSARKDFEQLATMAEQAPEKFEPADLQIVFYNAGVAAKAANNAARATALLQLAAAHPIDPEIASKVNAALAK